MTICQFGNHPSTRGALDKALHDEERLVYLLYRSAIFSDGRGDSRDTHGSTLELIDDGEQDLIVDFIESILVDIQGGQGYFRDVTVYSSTTLYLCEVAYPSQQGIGNTGCTA